MFRMDENQLNALLAKNPTLSVSKHSITKRENPPDGMQQHEERNGQNKYRNYPVYVFSDGFVFDSSIERMSRKEISDTRKRLANTHGPVTECYDSKKEYRRCLELRLLEKSGMITGLRRQHVLVIQPATQYRDEKLHAVTYCADFFYQENGVTVVEDVKGIDKPTGKPLTTQVFDLKWKLLKAKYPQYLFRIF